MKKKISDLAYIRENATLVVGGQDQNTALLWVTRGDEPAPQGGHRSIYLLVSGKGVISHLTGDELANDVINKWCRIGPFADLP